MKKLKKLLMLVPLLVAGCAMLTTNVFRTQQTSEDLVYMAYVGYTNYLTTHTIDSSLSNNIRSARLKFAATDATLDQLRLAYDTNSLLKDQITATISTLSDQASNIVWLVNFYKKGQ
jgi:hypothetical protein